MVTKLIMTIDRPHFVVKLHEELLEVDVKEGARKHLEKAVEANPIIRESLGLLFQTMIPLDVPLKDIKSVKVDDAGRLIVMIPTRKDLTIPLEVAEAERLAEKLNELIPLAKVKDAERTRKLGELEKSRQKPSELV